MMQVLRTHDTPYPPDSTRIASVLCEMETLRRLT